MAAKKRKGKLKMWFFIIAGVLVLAAGVAVAADAPSRNEVKNIVINDVNFKKLRDGVYTGKYIGTKSKLRNASVEVTVASGAISSIKVTEGAASGEKQSAEIKNGKSINSLFEDVKRLQSLKVDVISGATLTSKINLKALEEALKQAEMK